MQRSAQLTRDRLARKVPYHRSKFIFFMEADAVINDPQFIGIFFDQYVAAFPVGIIDQQVKEP